MELDLFAEEEPSPLEYARHHGLCRDFSREQLDIKSFLPPSVDQLSLDLDDSLESAITNPADELIKERLAVTKDAALLLKTVLSLQERAVENEQSPRPWKRDINLKQEVPILRTDPELDLQNFGNPCVPSFTDMHLPLESVDEEKDEGLGWSSKYFDYPSLCFERAKGEKFPVSKDVLRFLQDAVRDDWKPEDFENNMKESLSYSRNPALIPITPPLLPLSPPMTPYIPSSPDNRLQMLSDSSNSTAAELKALDQRIMNEDSLVPAFNTETSDDSMLLEEALNIYSSTDTELVELSSQTTKRKRSDLKVEGPLTPIMSSESPMKKIKSVTFKEMVAEYIPELPPTSDSENYNFSDFFKDATPLLEQVNKTITNEKLSEVDTTKRVDVPDVDFTLPIAPWAEFSRAKIGQPRDEETELEAQRKFLLEIKRNTLKSTPSWHRLSKPEREMDWNPFPTGMGRVTIEEELHGEDVLHDILAELTAGDIATSSTDIWKRDGLRILEDDDSDEEELEVAEFEEARTVETLVKKRILEIDDQTFRHESKPKGLNRETGVIGRPQRIERYREREQISAPRRQKGVPEQVPPEKKNENYLMFGGTFSATSALQNFMEVNGKNTPVEPSRSTQTSTHLPSMKKPKVNQPLCSTRGQSAAGTWSSHFPEVWNGEQENHGPPLSPLPQLPPIPGQLTPCSFIISSTLLIQRRLAREIEKIYPSAEMVERDFSLPHSPAQEADLLLSPSTGLIFTTLQQVKQQALPGQKNTSPIKERILGLQIRYERLIVLVGEGLSREAEQSRCARPVDSRDQGALAEFDKFTSRMEADVTTQYVRGGELALARTIVGEMAKWSLPHGSTDMGDLKLLQDETYWELFLRRAGFNTYASQIILASLKTPYDMPLVSDSLTNSGSSIQTVGVFGLPAFILMSTEERIKRFQILLGGSRIISRVNKLLDQEWPSAAHEFKM